MITIELDLSGCTVGAVELLADRMLDPRLIKARLADVGEAIATWLRDAVGADLVTVAIPLDIDDGTLEKAKRWQAVADFLTDVHFELRHNPAAADVVQQLLNGLEPGAIGEVIDIEPDEGERT